MAIVEVAGGISGTAAVSGASSVDMIVEGDASGIATTTGEASVDTYVEGDAEGTATATLPTLGTQNYSPNVFDSSNADHLFAELWMLFYLLEGRFTTGDTSLPATFQDSFATFLTLAEVGSLIEISDFDSPEDNGQYRITKILSDTMVEVDRDWPVGGNTNLSYALYWKIPSVDPYTDFLLAKLKKIKARWQAFIVDALED